MVLTLYTLIIMLDTCVILQGGKVKPFYHATTMTREGMGAAWENAVLIKTIHLIATFKKWGVEVSLKVIPPCLTYRALKIPWLARPGKNIYNSRTSRGFHYPCKPWSVSLNSYFFPVSFSLNSSRSLKLREVIPCNLYRREDARQPRHQELLAGRNATQTRTNGYYLSSQEHACL